MKNRGAIGLTGGIACGKSEVAGILRREGVPVLDTDAVAHGLLTPGHWVFEKVVQAFGREYLDHEGGINRRKLGKYIFDHDDARSELNRIMHPVILSEMEQWIKETLKNNAHAVAIVPLLFETGADELVEKVLVVAADDHRVRARLQDRGWTDEEISARIQAQLPLESKIARADSVIWNNEDLPALREATRNIWNQTILGKEKET